MRKLILGLACVALFVASGGDAAAGCGGKARARLRIFQRERQTVTVRSVVTVRAAPAALCVRLV